MRLLTLMHDAEATRVVYWDPQISSRISSIEFGDWHVVHRRGDAVVAKRGADECLLWHLSLGRAHQVLQ